MPGSTGARERRPIPPPTAVLPRRLPHRALPPYRYVPGLHPHPFRHPGGHLYTDGSAPIELPWDPGLAWEQDEAWLWGWELFDQRFYWEAHEAWEALWHQVPRGEATSELLQGLIQGAAFALKQHLGHRRGAERLLVRSTLHLRQAATGGGDPQRGLDLVATIGALEAFATGGDWPLLVAASLSRT